MSVEPATWRGEGETPAGISAASWVRAGIVAGLMVLVYWGPIRHYLVARWIVDGNWSHGWLIPLFSVYFLAGRREELRACRPAASYWGAAVLLSSLAAYFWSAWWARMAYPQSLSLVGAIVGATLLMGGWGVLRVAWFPIVFLVFAIPLPQSVYVELTRPLREWASTVAAAVMPLLVPGLHTEAQAVVIDYMRPGFPPGQLNVEEACSGMRLMMAFVTLGVAMAYLGERALWQRAVMVLTCLPIAVLCNAIRVTVTGWLTVTGHPDYAQGTPHQLLGIAMLVIALGCYSGVGYVLSHLYVEPAEAARSHGGTLDGRRHEQAELVRATRIGKTPPPTRGGATSRRPSLMTTLTTTVQDEMASPKGRGFGDSGGPPGVSDVIAMLRRRTVLVVVLVVLLSGAAVGGFAAWWFVFPGFRGECLVECVSNIPERNLSIEQERLQQDEHERFVLTQAILLKSPSILGEALKVNAVRETEWFKSVMRGKRKPQIELERDLTASPVRGTNFLRVAIECRDPKDPAVIVNEVVNQWYHTVKKRTAEEVTSDALDAANKELVNLDKDLAEQRDRLKAMAQKLPAGARQAPAENITAQAVKQYGEQVAQLHLELSQLEQYRTIYNDPEGVAVTAEDRAIVEQDPQVAELARAAFIYEQQRSADEKVYGAGHNVLRQLDSQIAAAQAKLSQLRLAKLRERRADIREAANTAYDNTRHALFLAQENLAKAEAELLDQDRLLFDYYELEVQAHRDGQYKLQLENYVKSLERIKTQRMAIHVNVAQPATEPLERSSPSLFLLPMGVLLALLLSVGIALGLEVLDKSVRTSQDVVRHLDVALLGAIPHTDDEETAIARVETAVHDHPRSLVAEAFRGVRTSLQFSAPAERQRLVLATSPRPLDGTTTVACNLAMTLAQGGRRVLLVDANLRRPGLHLVFGAIKAKGLSNLLIGEGTLEGYAVRTALPLLDVLGSGPTPPNPTELLGGPQCRAFLQEAASRYDQVILDTPPALLASDALVLSTLVDGVILVVRANRNSRGVAKRALGALADVNAHLFGAVLNAAQVTRGGYFREQLRAHYEYQPEAGGASPPTPLGPKPT